MKLDQLLEKKIVSSIATMDRRTLDLVLPDNGVYDNTYKEVWLAKLFAMYNTCLLNGDESFKMYEHICEKEEHPMFGQKVYSFVAPITQWCLMLCFVVENDVFVGLQQYYCFREFSRSELFGLLCKLDIGLNIYDDEMIGYIETEDHRELKIALKDFNNEMKSERRNVIGRKWLYQVSRKYSWLHGQSYYNYYCEEIVIFNNMINDFLNMYNFMRKPDTYVNLYTKYKALAGKDDKTSVLKRRKLIAKNMLLLFSFYTSRNFGMENIQYFTYSYNIDKTNYKSKIFLRDPRIEVDGYFSFIRESKVVISYLFEAYQEDVKPSNEYWSIEDVEMYYRGKLDKALVGMAL